MFLQNIHSYVSSRKAEKYDFRWDGVTNTVLFVDKFPLLDARQSTSYSLFLVHGLAQTKQPLLP